MALIASDNRRFSLTTLSNIIVNNNTIATNTTTMPIARICTVKCYSIS